MIEYCQTIGVVVLGVAIASCGACQDETKAHTTPKSESVASMQKESEQTGKRKNWQKPQLEMGSIQIVGRKYAPTFSVELAQSETERNRGLMFRRKMADEAGMLFFMPGDSDWAFYMRNTYISLDMIFIDRDWRVVGVQANVPPLTEALRRTGKPCRYVLELNAHEAGKHGINAGTQLQFERGPTP